MIGRMRGVRPTYFQNGELYDLEEATKLPIRVALKGLECWTDRAGRFEWRPRELKLNILPYDPVDFALVLDALDRGNFVAKYEIGGRVYGVMNPEVWEQQNINKNEAQSEIPEPPAGTMQRFEQRALTQGFHSYRDEARPEPAVTETNGLESALTEAKIPAYADSLEVKGREVEVNGKEGKEVQQPGGHAIVSSTVPEAIPSPISGADRGVLSLVPQGSDRDSGRRVPRLPAIVGQRTQQAILQRLALVAAEMQDGTRQRLVKQDLRVLQAEVVFSYWQAKTGHAKAIFDEKRERLIVRHLETNGGDVSELLYAIDGSLKDRHLQGENDRNRKYDGIETIFRDRAQVERLADTIKDYRNNITHGIVDKYSAAIGGAAVK